MVVRVQSPEEASGQSSVLIFGFPGEAKLTVEELQTPALSFRALGRKETIPEEQKTGTVQRASGHSQFEPRESM